MALIWQFIFTDYVIPANLHCTIFKPVAKRNITC
jgi:hypothetical protein